MAATQENLVCYRPPLNCPECSSFLSCLVLYDGLGLSSGLAQEISAMSTTHYFNRHLWLNMSWFFLVY